MQCSCVGHPWTLKFVAASCYQRCDNRFVLKREGPVAEPGAVAHTDARSQGRHTEPPVPRTPSPRRWVRWVRAATAVLLLVGIGWFVWSGWRVEQESSALQETLIAIRTDAGAMDSAAMVGHLTTLREKGALIEGLTSSPPWIVAEKIPWLGDNVAALRSLADAVNGVAQSTVGLDPLLPGLSPSQIRRADGRVDLATIERAAPVFSDIKAALVQARERLDPIATRDLVGPVASAVLRARDAICGSAAEPG